MAVQIFPVRTPEQMAAIKTLFREYQAFLAINLDFQDFEAELAGLPGKYSPPKGDLFLAVLDDEPVGCGAFYPMQEAICEIKRVYVKPQTQGHGIGKKLFRHLIESAAQAGYRYVRLDSLKRLDKAANMYRAFGFYEIEPYNENPHNDVYYMELDLAQAGLLQ